MGAMSGPYMLTDDIHNVGTQSKIYYPISRFALGRRHYPSGDFGSVYSSCKRAKLDNLTEEQKVARRKILNREAAQKARDRKRDMVASMEKDLATIQAENEHLRAANRFLRKKFFEQEEKFMMLEKKLRSLYTEQNLRFGEDDPNSHDFHCSPLLFDGPVVEVSTCNADQEAATSTVPPLSSHLNTESSSLYDQILDSLQDESIRQPPVLTPSSNSTDDLNDLMEFLYNDGFTPDHDERTM
ncbi:hypothetical protein D915_005439 [Fasciola hepatica]|uniref:X-box-binding protein 1 n=1 Tax=Fasciola hepatica TaxID=6192 RepID=A0A2H1C9L6_FASHE|nr:hypothetical protein D915_005439 [Fasciola hepatica]